MPIRKTKLDQIKYQVTNHSALSVIIAFGLIIISIASFTDATSKIITFMNGLLTNESISVEGTIRSKNVKVRWNGDSRVPWYYSLKDTKYQNELRLDISFKNVGKQEANVEGMRILMNDDGKKIIWEGAYETDSLPLIRNASINRQIQKNRNDLIPFQLGGTYQDVLFKTIHFVPIKAKEEMTIGIYNGLLQMKESSKDVWLDIVNFSFEIPSDFKLVEYRKDGQPKRLKYNYWQSFNLHYPKPVTN